MSKNILTQIDSVAGVSIYRVTPSAVESYLYIAGFTIDADGSPRCYGPNNSGIDFTANGGTPGSTWWGGPVDKNKQPIVQKIYEPCPGMYVSGTSLCNPAFKETSQYRYINSEEIPFFVLPGGGHTNGASLGDVGLVYRKKTEDNCYAIYADTGPSSKIGEGSMRLASALKLNNDPKKGGAPESESRGFAYLVFPKTVGKWVPPDVWFDVANTSMHAWGGLGRLKEILADLSK
jgi:Fungal chitosanase of glycosyl hydrolase group 75